MLLRSKEHEVVEVALSCSPADEAGASQESLAATSPRFHRKNQERCDFSATGKSPISCDTFE
jgi:hypothetical protein